MHNFRQILPNANSRIIFKNAPFECLRSGDQTDFAAEIFAAGEWYPYPELLTFKYLSLDCLVPTSPALLEPFADLATGPKSKLFPLLVLQIYQTLYTNTNKISLMQISQRINLQNGTKDVNVIMQNHRLFSMYQILSQEK